MFYTIDSDLNVTAHEARPACQEGRICFSTLSELQAATAVWPMNGFADVWNDLAGTPGFFEVRKVKKFENRGIATRRLFAAIDAAMGEQHPADAEIEDALRAVVSKFDLSCATDEGAATIAAEEDMKKSKTKTAAKPTVNVRGSKHYKIPKVKAAGAAVGTTNGEPTRKDTIVGLIGRKKGATITEIMDATGWQKHSVRGFIATLKTKGGFAITSEKNAAGERVYQGSAA